MLLDVKRGDIGSTSEAYADAYLDPASPLAADAITVSPYLGFGSLDPVRRRGAAPRRGPVRARPDLEQGGTRGPARHGRATGESVGLRMLEHLRVLNADAEPLGSFGAVVGATIGDADTGADFAFNGPILAPGYGAQGGTTADIRRIFGAAATNVAASSSVARSCAPAPMPRRCETSYDGPTTPCPVTSRRCS